MAFAITKSLLLRAYRNFDAEPLLGLYNDPLVARSTRTADPVVPISRGKQQAFAEGINRALLSLIIEVRDDYNEGHARQWNERERRVGHVALNTGKPRHLDLGIALMPRWWGKGFGTEATEWLVKYVFEQLGVHRVFLGVFTNNPRAVSLYRKMYVGSSSCVSSETDGKMRDSGFVEEGRDRQAIWQDGAWVDQIHMSILENEYWERKRSEKAAQQ